MSWATSSSMISLYTTTMQARRESGFPMKPWSEPRLALNTARRGWWHSSAQLSRSCGGRQVVPPETGRGRIQPSRIGRRRVCSRWAHVASSFGGRPDDGSGAYELSDRSVRRTALEAENQPNSQGVGQSLKRFNARLVATALDTGDRRMAGTDSPGQLLLGDPQSSAMPDDQPGKFLELGKALLLSAVGSALTRTPGSRLRGRRADGTLPRHASSFCLARKS